MTTYIQRCMVVTAKQQALAQRLCKGLAGSAGDGMFLTGASTTGRPPATHFVNEGMVEDTFAGTLAAAATLLYVCGLKEVPVTLTECTALLEGSDVSTDGPFEALTRLNLKLVQYSLDGNS